jgi:hypothetical protein
MINIIIITIIISITNGKLGGFAANGPPGTYPETWDDPGTSFEAWVADTVRHRLGKYTQPDHPAQVTQEDAAQLFRKVRKIVIDTEKKVSSLFM